MAGNLSQARVARWPGHLALFSDEGSFTFAVSDPFERSADAAASADAIRAPMPGLVKLVRVEKGDAVAKGQSLLVLEAMKMEHSITAPHDATIAEILVEGRQVTDGEVLVRFEIAPAKPASS
jgi:3-methylcrotonyl-CoA carboxylase alpha subunit